jgi:hypothetical protein
VERRKQGRGVSHMDAAAIVRRRDFANGKTSRNREPKKSCESQSRETVQSKQRQGKTEAMRG